MAENHYHNDSIAILVNKSHPLTEDDIPLDLVPVDVPFDYTGKDMRNYLRAPAAEALKRLFDAAEAAGLDLIGVSGYRSYERQKEIYENNLITTGKIHTMRYSAPPGASEHQTGLAMDISTPSIGSELIQAFEDTPEGKWLKDNAHPFGFILRYPEGKEKITGYAYEPWHYRYVGPALAVWLYENGLTLEEYYKKLGIY